MSDAAPIPRWRGILKHGLQAAIAIGLLGFLARRVPLGEALAALADATPGLWMLGIGLSAVVLVLGAWRWHLTALRTIPMRTCLAYSWIGHFYSTVLPGAVVGDVAKAASLATSDTQHRTMVLPVSVALDRLLGLISLLLVLAVALAAMSGEKKGLHPSAVAFFSGVVVAILVLTPQIIRAVLSLARKLRFLPHRVMHALDRVSFVIGQVGVSSWIFMLVLSVLMHAISGVVFIAAAREFGMHVEAWRLGLYYVALCIVIMLPVTIAGIGLREQVSLWILGTSSGAAVMPVTLSWFLLVVGAVHAVIGGLMQLAGWLRAGKRRS